MQINHNIRAMITQHSLYTNNNAMSKSLEKLSTGLRVNRAQDDAAGLAMSEQMRNQIRSLGKAKQNSLDGIAALQIAEGALGEITSMMQRQKELAVQAANDTLTSTERMYLNDEFEALTKEIKRVAETTDYNGKNVLLFDSDPNKSFGATKLNPYNEDVELMNASRVLYKAFGDNLTVGSLSVLSISLAGGATQSVASKANELIISINGVITDLVDNRGGVLDMDRVERALISIIGIGHNDISITGTKVYLDGDKLFTNTASYSGLAGGEKTVSNQQALKDVNAFLKSAADALAALQAAKVGGANVEAGVKATISYAMFGTLKDMAGSPKAGTATGLTNSDITGVTITGIKSVDNIAGKLTTSLSLASLAGIFGSSASEQVQKDVTSLMQIDTAKMAPSEVKDKIVALQKTVGLLQDAYKNYAERNYAVGSAASEILHVGANYSKGLGGPLANEIGVNYVAVDIKGLGLDSQAIDGQKAATRAIDRLDEVIKVISGNRAAIGTYINRLEYTVNNIASMTYNTQEAESRIRDTDFSKETTEFTKNQIMVQSATSILAQANSLPQAVLGLIG